MSSRLVRIACAATIVGCALTTVLGQNVERPFARSGALVSAFSVETIAPGVDVYRPDGRGRTHANSLLVELDRGWLVVDAQPTPQAARELIASLQSRSSKPIRYVVLTHPHVTSSGGAREFPAETVRIATRGHRDALADPQFDYVAEMAHAPDRTGVMDAERPLPDLILFGRTRIEDSRRTVILLPVAHAHSPGDLLVFLPEDGIVAAGDLVFPGRTPYAGSARVSGWLAQLNQLVSLSPRRIVPSRGPVVGPEVVRANRDSLQWLSSTVAELLGDGEDVETIPATLRDEPGFRRHLQGSDGDDLDLLISVIVDEERERRRRNGLE